MSVNLARWNWMAAVSLILGLSCLAHSAEPNRGIQTLEGKVVVGYQGWFGAPHDGQPDGGGWVHWTRDAMGVDGKEIAGSAKDGFEGKNAKVDLWPDESAYAEGELYPSNIVHANGSRARVFSSCNAQVVNRHFQWMHEYGIDAAFLQRFLCDSIDNPRACAFNNLVLKHVMDAAVANKVSYCIEYDMSGFAAASQETFDVRLQKLKADWIGLVQQHGVLANPWYVHHNGRPLVMLWGITSLNCDTTIGEGGARTYAVLRSPAQEQQIIDFFRSPEAGACTIAVGVRGDFRTFSAPLANDLGRKVDYTSVIASADIICPWSVGAYKHDDEIERAMKSRAIDVQWCEENRKLFIPVIWPGFSWHNMYTRDPSGSFPRKGGQFMWTQAVAHRRLGINTMFIAMFDEVDEGTAIFKLSNNPPPHVSYMAGEHPEVCRFVNETDVPTDRYLRVAYAVGKLLRREIPDSDRLPNVDDMLAIPIVSGPFCVNGIVGKKIHAALQFRHPVDRIDVRGLPAGLAIDQLTGVLDGVSEVSGSWRVSIQAANAWGTGSATVLVEVSEAK